MPNEVTPRISRQRTDLCVVGGLPRTRDLVFTLQGGFLGKQDRMNVSYHHLEAGPHFTKTARGPGDFYLPAQRVPERPLLF